MSNSKNTTYYKVTTHVTVPASATGTGTFSSAANSNQVVGTSTLFLTELKPGDWLADITHNELRKVVAIGDNTSLVLEEGFTNTQTAATIVIVAKSNAKAINIVADDDTVTIDGTTVPGAGTYVVFNKGSRSAIDSHSPTDFIDPVIVDATGHNAWITILR